MFKIKGAHTCDVNAFQNFSVVFKSWSLLLTAERDLGYRVSQSFHAPLFSRRCMTLA